MTDAVVGPVRRRWPFGPIPTLVIITVVLSIVFMAFPSLDLWFSRQFYDPTIGFAASHVPAFVWLRSLSDFLVWLIAGVAVVSILVKIALPERKPLIPVQSSAFLLGTLVIGPLLLVNVLFKSVWGRPRPIEIVNFGGDHPFVSAWHFSNYCQTNCSFVSGEASTAIWLVALALVVPQRWRRQVATAAFVLAGIFSINRIAFGGHFLSDVLLGWSMTLLVIAVLHHFMFVRPRPWLTEDVLAGGLATAGRRIRGLVRRGPARTGEDWNRVEPLVPGSGPVRPARPGAAPSEEEAAAALESAAAAVAEHIGVQPKRSWARRRADRAALDIGAADLPKLGAIDDADPMPGGPYAETWDTAEDDDQVPFHRFAAPDADPWEPVEEAPPHDAIDEKAAGAERDARGAAEAMLEEVSEDERSVPPGEVHDRNLPVMFESPPPPETPPTGSAVAALEEEHRDEEVESAPTAAPAAAVPVEPPAAPALPAVVETVPEPAKDEPADPPKAIT